jgi:hypothetical protein
MDLPTLVKQADSIIQGTVDHIEVKWEAGNAYTYTYVNVADPMKGERARTVTVKQLGGKVGNLTQFVSGMPKFEKGEEVILFLKKNQASNTSMVLGLNQGKYEITKDYAVSNVSGVELFNPKTGKIETAAFVERAPVETLKAKIRELLK